jgi:ribonuclease Z
MREIIFENSHLTIETIPLVHKIDCSGFLFREKQKPRRIDKERLPEGLAISQLAGLKQGEDVKDEEGNVLYKNKDLTLAPKRARSYAYCSDTQYSEAMVDQLGGVDVLYHEATFMEVDRDKAVETRHSTASDAARIAKLAGVSKLLIGHFSARYRELEPLLLEARAIFKETYLALEQESTLINE